MVSHFSRVQGVDVEAAWLAVSAAALLGALAVGYERYRRRLEAKAWLESVRSVIAGDPDAAVEALSDAARLGSPQAIETYLALGQLFRRNGDFSRALRLHRNMLHGPAVPASRRGDIERELAEDYRRSGMLAEAAEIYRRLAPSDRAAAAGLRDVLVEGGDLAGAIEVQNGLGPTDPEGGDPVLGHLYAARARALCESDLSQAAEAAERAVKACQRSADARLATAEVAALAGDAAAALKSVDRALDLDPRSAFLAWPALKATRDARGVLEYLEACLSSRPTDSGLHLLRGRTLARLGLDQAALSAFRLALFHDRNGEGLNALRELLQDPRSTGPGDLAARHALLVEVLARRAPPLRCRRCGAAAASLSFRCAACGAFSSL